MDYQRWHVGQNMPGYMPNDGPYCMVGTEADAIAAVKDEAERVLDDCDLGDDCTGSHDVGEGGDYFLDEAECSSIGSGGLHIWYAQCDEPAECEAEDHNQHNCGGAGECSICDAEESEVAPVA